jgi:uncharacterized membrane protein
MRDEIWGVVQAFPSGMWGILTLCAVYFAGWYFTGWYFKRDRKDLLEACVVFAMALTFVIAFR